MVPDQAQLQRLLQLSREGVHALLQSALPEIASTLHNKIQDINLAMTKANAKKPNQKFIGMLTLCVPCVRNAACDPDGRHAGIRRQRRAQ